MATGDNDLLQLRVTSLVTRILCTGTPQAEAVVAMLRRHLDATDDPAQREAVMARFEQALAGEGGGIPAFDALARTTLDTLLCRAGWSIVAGTMPRATALAAVADLLYRGSWTQIAAALPVLAGCLPSLRTHAQFEALVAALPAALRDSLAALHAEVEQMDAPFSPRLQVAPMIALVVAASLWQAQRWLPPANAPQGGLPGFIAALPRYWQRLAGLNRAAGALLAPSAPPAPLPQLTHVRTPGRIAPAAVLPLHDAVPPPTTGHGGPLAVPPHHEGVADEAALPLSMASAAPRNENALIALGVTLFTSGLVMIRQGWELAFGAPASVPYAVPGVEVMPAAHLRPVEEVIVLLDDILDIDGNLTVLEDIHTRIRDVAGQGYVAQVQAVRERLIVNDVVEQVLAGPEREAAEAVRASAHPRARRAVSGHVPVPTPVGNVSLTVGAQDGLTVASQQLVDAIQDLPSGPSQPEEEVIGNKDRVGLALARMHLRRWMREHGRTPAQQKFALTAAVRALGLSEEYLRRVTQGLPDLDTHIEGRLVEQIGQIAQLAVEPRAVFLNTFQTYLPWPEWEARQVPGPDPELQSWYQPYPRTERVGEGLVSSRDLVEAAVQPLESEARSGLYHSGTPGTYFPNEKSKLTLAQYNQAVNGSDYLGSFRAEFEAFAANCSRSGPHPVRDAYVEAMSRRLEGTTTLSYAMGQINEGRWLVRTLLQYPTKFGGGAGNGTLGRAFALPGQTIRVNALVAECPGGNVSLHGLVLAESFPSPERPTGAVVAISPTRLPLLQEFASRAEALQHLASDVPHQLHSWVPAQFHARWRSGNGPVVLGTEVEGDFLHHLLTQQLELLGQRLNQTGETAAETRRDFIALNRRLQALPLPVAAPVMEAANERVASTMVDPYEILGVHWLLRLGLPSRGVLDNASVEDARWLSYMDATRRLLEFTYPTPARYVANALEREILNSTGVAIDTTDHYLVRFSGGTASVAAPSGFVHDVKQKIGACRLVECAFDKARGYPDGATGSSDLGIYTSDNSTVYDQDTEVAGLLPGQFISVVRGLDLRTGYLAAIDAFWRTQRDEVKICLRGVFMFSAWQQFAEGSLSAHGLQLAIASTGYMLTSQAEDPAFKCHLADGTRVSWVNIYGASSTLMRIDHAQGPEVLLYSPGDEVAFREFPDAAQLALWLGRVAGSPQGRGWLEAAFDLADLQDGWFSNGVSSTLGTPPDDLFKGNSTGPLIEGEDLFDAMATRLQQRTRNDAGTLLSSNWETWRDLLQRRLQVFDLVLGLASIPIPALLPIVAVGAGIETGLGVEEAIDGRSEADRHEGRVNAAWGAAGVALTVPFVGAHAAARTAALSTAEGARFVPALRAVADTTRVDPLASLSARYAQPAGLVVEGARPADNGIYHFAGRHYIRQSGNVYEVAFDKFNRTWRLKNPNPGSLYQNPVRLNPEGMWEPHGDVGLRGGAPEPSNVARSGSLDVYRNAVQVEIERSTQSLDSAGADFVWGRTHSERVVLPKEALEADSLARLRELFVSGRLEPAQRGALSVIIARMERTMRIERTLRVEEAVASAVQAHDGSLLPFSQMMLDTKGETRMGWCTGMSRIVALAMAQGKQVSVVRNLRLAMRRPGEGLGAELLGSVRDAQGVALLPGTVSASAPIEYTELGKFLDSVKGNGQFFLTGAVHHMVVGVTQLPNGAKLFELGDPNIGLIRFFKRSKFDRLIGYLFGSRYFSALSGDASRETLAAMYGARPATRFASETQFMIRQVDPEKLARQARARGWDRLLREVPE